MAEAAVELGRLTLEELGIRLREAKRAIETQSAEPEGVRFRGYHLDDARALVEGRGVYGETDKEYWVAARKRGMKRAKALIVYHEFMFAARNAGIVFLQAAVRGIEMEIETRKGPQGGTKTPTA